VSSCADLTAELKEGLLKLFDLVPVVPVAPSTVEYQMFVQLVASFATSTSSYSRKARPESLLMDLPNGPLVLGIALVDFNHQVRCYNFVEAIVT
jgi:hypothetical protein